MASIRKTDGRIWLEAGEFNQFDSDVKRKISFSPAGMKNFTLTVKRPCYPYKGKKDVAQIFSGLANDSINENSDLRVRDCFSADILFYREFMATTKKEAIEKVKKLCKCNNYSFQRN